jgi:uncharacterized membrane protein (DUF485 family)
MRRGAFESHQPDHFLFAGNEGSQSRAIPAAAIRNFARAAQPAVIRPMSAPHEDKDYTPIVGSQTDIAQVGRSGPKPEHERTADEDIDPVPWSRIADDADFKALVRRKLRLIVPATVFFIVYYFLLPIGVGWFPGLMEKKVWGAVNLAYAYALSQFFMAWILAGIYVAAAAGWDRSEHALLRKFGVQHR